MPRELRAKSGRLGALLAGPTLALSLVACGEVLTLEPWNPSEEGGTSDAGIGSDADAHANTDAPTRCGDPRLHICEGFDDPWDDTRPSGWQIQTAGTNPPSLTRSETVAQSAPYSLAAESVARNGAFQQGAATLFVRELESPLPPPFAVEFDLYMSEAPPSPTLPGQSMMGSYLLMANVASAASMTPALELGYQRHQDIVRFFPCLSVVGPTADDGVPAKTWLHVVWTVTETEERLTVSQGGEQLIFQQSPNARELGALRNIGLGLGLHDGTGRWLVHYDNARVRQLN